MYNLFPVVWVVAPGCCSCFTLDGYEGPGTWICSSRNCHPNLTAFGKLVPEIWGGRKCAGQLWDTRNKQWHESIWEVGLQWPQAWANRWWEMLRTEFANTAGSSAKENPKINHRWELLPSLYPSGYRWPSHFTLGCKSGSAVCGGCASLLPAISLC